MELWVEVLVIFLVAEFLRLEVKMKRVQDRLEWLVEFFKMDSEWTMKQIIMLWKQSDKEGDDGVRRNE